LFVVTDSITHFRASLCHSTSRRIPSSRTVSSRSPT
jgi:hypothetical protein